MKKIYLLPIAIITLSLAFTSCKKEDTPEKTVSEKIAGHWATGNQYLQNNLVATSDGSYLEFNANAAGVDHKASDNSTGAFTWHLQNTDTQILFADTTNVGGFWNGTYDIVSITDTKLVIKATSILGEYKCELNK